MFASREAHVAAHLDAVAVGQPHVDDCDVGTSRRDAADRLFGRSCFAHDFDVVVLLEQIANAPAHHFVIVNEEHSNRHAVLLLGSVRPLGPTER